MFFKFIIYVLIITVIIRWLGFSLKVFSAFRSAKKQQSNVNRRKEGEVNITYQPEKGKKIKSSEGEYIEYEEFKD